MQGSNTNTSLTTYLTTTQDSNTSPPVQPSALKSSPPPAPPIKPIDTRLYLALLIPAMLMFPLLFCCIWRLCFKKTVKEPPPVQKPEKAQSRGGEEALRGDQASSHCFHPLMVPSDRDRCWAPAVDINSSSGTSCECKLVRDWQWIWRPAAMQLKRTWGLLAPVMEEAKVPRLPGPALSYTLRDNVSIIEAKQTPYTSFQQSQSWSEQDSNNVSIIEAKQTKIPAFTQPQPQRQSQASELEPALSSNDSYRRSGSVGSEWIHISNMVEEVVKKFEKQLSRLKKSDLESLGGTVGHRVNSLPTPMHLKIMQDPDQAGHTYIKPHWVGDMASDPLAQCRGSKNPVTIIALTDGTLLKMAFKETKKEAEKARKLGAVIYGVGVNDYRRDQLNEIADSKKHVFGVDTGFEDLVKIADSAEEANMALMEGVLKGDLWQEGPEDQAQGCTGVSEEGPPMDGLGSEAA
ncbi:Anthrax toxin receptor-like protein [Myotis davidii]|uniref:Anthrax toxin receptor-like protein n=1 Tax=Myotis davidii TaxID=225400 RepID=L5M9C3_MYODS|nr:Anthrax toxin receptor-like protein [Myotis davidii]